MKGRWFAAPLVAVLAGLCPAQSSENAQKIAELLQQAQAAEEMGNPDEAEGLLRAALDVDSNDVAVVTALGKLLVAHEQGAEGIALLYRALELEPKHLAAATALVDELLAQRDWYESQGDTSSADANLARAGEVVERARSAGLTANELELRRLRVLSRADATAKTAFEVGQAIVTSDPENQEFHAALVDAATAAKEFDAALAFYENVQNVQDVELAPWIRPWFSAAIRAARATYRFNHYEDDEAAVQDYLAADQLVLEAARVNPGIFEAASERASFYRSWAGWVRFTRQQRTEEAWELFMSAHGRNPDNQSAIEGMSWACQRLYEAGDLEATCEYSRQACVIAPERADFWNNYALICRDLGQYEESYRAYRRAMALAPDDGRIVNDCALILQYHLHRDLDLAERWLIRAEDLARAALAQAQQDADDSRIAEHRMVLGDALVNLARLYSDQGRMQEAGEHWNELREVDTSRAELPENGGRANLPGQPASASTPQNGGNGSGGANGSGGR